MRASRGRTSLVVALGLAGLLLPAPAGAREKYTKGSRKDRAAVIWRSTARGGELELEVEKLAARAAPILWFSSDEPLLLTRRDIPQARRCGCCEPEPEGAVVYYRISKVLARGGAADSARARIRQGWVPLQSVRALTITYYFYYERDFGLNPHCHDLEGADFDLEIDSTEGAPRVTLARVTGLAHGSRLMSNILQIKPHFRNRQGAPDVRLPVTLFVEEGKHASCPDRNGDGLYTPGYDVNIRVSDAWGLRDVFGSGVIGSGYQAWMGKPRSLEHRVGPPLPKEEFRAFEIQAGELTPLATGPGYPDKQYRLELARKEAACPPSDKKGAFITEECRDEAGQTHEEPNALNMARSTGQKFVEAEVTDDASTYRWGHGWVRQGLQYLAVGGRLDGTDPGFNVGVYPGYGLPKFGGWFNLRGSLLRDEGRWNGALDLLYTPSIARLADWYAGAGIDWLRPLPSDHEVDPALEGGLQLRVQGICFRVGVRSALDEGRFRRTRLVFELGWGPSPTHARVH